MISAFHIAEFPAWVQGQLMPGELYIGVYDQGRVIARSPGLRDAGLRLGESIDRARSLFPDARFHEHDPCRDMAIWEDLLYLLADQSPELLSLKPGWALLKPYDQAALDLLAGTLAARAGTAPRRFAAMMAALQVEAGNVRRLSGREVTTFIEQSLVRYLREFGFEIDLIERLELFGLYTVGRVSRLTRRHLKAQFGEEGIALFDLLHPEGDDPPIPRFQPPPSVAAAYEFETSTNEPAELLPVLDHLLEEVVRRLGALHAQLLTIRLQGRADQGVRIVRRVLKTPTARPEYLRVVATTLLDRMVSLESPVDAMTIELGGLVQREAVQGGLFADRPAVYESVRQIHRRFPGRLLRAVITDREAYLPEDGVRLEPYPAGPPDKRRGRR